MYRTVDSSAYAVQRAPHVTSLVMKGFSASVTSLSHFASATTIIPARASSPCRTCVAPICPTDPTDGPFDHGASASSRLWMTTTASASSAARHALPKAASYSRRHAGYSDWYASLRSMYARCSTTALACSRAATPRTCHQRCRGSCGCWATCSGRSAVSMSSGIRFPPMRSTSCGTVSGRSLTSPMPKYPTVRPRKTTALYEEEGLRQIPQQELREVLLECFDAKHRLAEVLLHALAHAQHIMTGQPAGWRSMINEEPKMALRLLVYPPGPLSANPVVTTASHTDGTWITLLTVDSTGGLQVMQKEGWLDVKPGGILASTGNVLGHASRRFFPAVCHRVVRVSDTLTRFSMPFFWDKAGSSTGGC